MTHRFLLCGLALGLVASCQRSTNQAPADAPPAKATAAAPSVPAAAPAHAANRQVDSMQRLKEKILREIIEVTADALYRESKRAKGEIPAPSRPSKLDMLLQVLFEPVGHIIGEAVASGFTELIVTEGPKYWSAALKASDPVETQLVAVWWGWFLTGRPEVPTAEKFQLKVTSKIPNDVKPEKQSEPSMEPCFSIYLLRPRNAPAEPVSTLIVGRDDAPFLRFTRAHAPIERPLAILAAYRPVKGKLSHFEQTLVYGPDGKWIPLPTKERREKLPEAAR